jgi:uncharacterized lipoprotein YajG
MNRFAKIFLHITAGMIAMVWLNGCATNKIGISYTPQTNVTPVAGAERVSLKLEVVDGRLVQDRIGHFQESTNDVAFVPLTATNDPTAVLKQAVATELVNRGFKLSDKGTSLVVQLDTLYGIFTEKHQWPELKYATATAEISVRLRKPDGRLIFHTTATGEAEEKNLGSSANSAVTVNQALEACLAHLFADPKFINALLNASS